MKQLVNKLSSSSFNDKRYIKKTLI